MKKIRFLLVCVLLSLCALVYAGDVCSVSYDSNGNMKLRAGLKIDGDVTWSSPAAWYFDKAGVSPLPYPGKHMDGDKIAPDDFSANGATWDTTGRWFVTMAADKSTEAIHYSNGIGSRPSYAKSMNNGMAHNLTWMVTGTDWKVDDTFTGEAGDDINYITSNTTAAGKFCTFRVRVTDANGANERYYWVGDTGTGSFTYYREWVADNFVNNKGKGKYGEYGEAVWSIANENIDVYIVVSTLYDQARFEINLVNNSAETKYVSFGMYGTPATNDNPGLQWGHKPYIDWTTSYDKDGKINGWDLDYSSAEFDPYDPNLEKFWECDPVYYYLPGVGTIDTPQVLSKNSIPDRLEMYSYRWVNANTRGDAGLSRLDDTELGENCVDSTYMLPPKESFVNDHQYSYKGMFPTKQPGSDTAFQSVAQATFDNNGDATKPDYLIIDNSSNMLQFSIRTGQNKYPFGFYTDEVYGSPIAPDDGSFPAGTYWPGNETGVMYPYEATIDSSKTWPYVDQFTDPLSYMAVWGNKAIAAGKTRKIVTYYGLGGKSFINGQMSGQSNFTRQNHSLFVESPTVLGYQVTKDEVGNDRITPEIFTVKPIITNQGIEKGYYDFKVNKIYITLDEGLELASNYDGDGGVFELSEDPNLPENTYVAEKSVTLGKLGVYNAMSIRVKVTGEYSGTLSYTVKIDGKDVSGGSGWSQEVSRSILVPTTKTGKIYGGPGNLLANPFKNVTASGSTGENPFTITDVYGSDTAGFIWNAQKQAYETFSELDGLNQTHQGYWILKGVDEDSDSVFSYTFPKYTKPNDINYGDIEDSKYYMAEIDSPLYAGWNIVSCPFVYPMQWVNVVVKNKMTGDIKTMDDAVSAGWLYKTIFTWEPTKLTDGSMDPTTSKYVGHNTVTTELIPNKGYWVYATRDLQIYFKPALYPDSKIFDDDYYTDPDKFFKLGYATDENGL